MIDPVFLAVVAAAGLSAAVSGVLLQLRRTWIAGALLGLAGVVTVTAAFLGAAGHDGEARFALVAGSAMIGPLALTSYPRLLWRNPVDFVALATVAGAGALATAQWNSLDVLGPMGTVIGFTLVLHTWWRIEHSAGRDRWALTWMALGGSGPGLVAGVMVFAAPETTVAALSLGLFVLVGPAMYVGVTRPELIDVRALVIHAVVFALAAVVYVALFVTLDSVVEILSGTPPSVGAAALVGLICATTFGPARVMLRGVVDELLFGQRPDPLDAAANVVAGIGDDPVLALRAIREALVLPFAAVSVDGTQLASSGSAVTHTRRMILELGDGHRGELVVGLRPGDLRLAPADERVLSLVAPLLAQTLRATGLATDLQVSRKQTITALEEERRRLRRDLHDGLAPRLTGIAFTADAARNTLRSDAEGADALLAALRSETGVAIDEIRRIVYAMRPPALDELGLVPALRQQAVAIRTARGEPLRVAIKAELMPEPVSAAVEVAAYRIVMEALTNVARHSDTNSARVCLQVEAAALVIDVKDRGTSSGEWSTGVGIASMRERAGQLGGTLTAEGTPVGGHVHAVLPLRTN